VGRQISVNILDAGSGSVVAGRYRLISEIGRGGMGRVWEARDTQLDRPVAIKEVLIPDLLPPQREVRLQQALREGRNAAAMADHPNIVTVYDVVLDHGSPWIVMQLVRGRSLSHVLRDPNRVGTKDDEDVSLTPLKPKRVALIAEAMLDALRAMHEAGIVHRDVKPHNILLGDDGGILLTDFGIAKSDSDTTMTIAGSVIGTLAYIAPERAEGEPGTPASDFFSLGVTLFEAVEGYSPFEKKNSTTGTLTAILTKPLPQMHKAGRLAPLIKALTDKSPRRRPDNGQALALLRGNGTPAGQQAPAGSAETLPATVTSTVARPQAARVQKPPPSPKQPAPRPSMSSTSQPSSTSTSTSAATILGGIVATVVIAVVAGIIGFRYYDSHQKTAAANHKACQDFKAADAEKNEALNTYPSDITQEQEDSQSKVWSALETHIDTASGEAVDTNLKSDLDSAASGAGKVAQTLASHDDANMDLYYAKRMYQDSYSRLISPIFGTHGLCGT
jgi:serine/threonine protein kinase